MLKYFNERSKCPCCNSDHVSELLRLEWGNKILLDLFKYRKFPTDFIKEASYILMECNRCCLIYQRYAPNNQLSYMIYNEWLKKRRLANIFDYSFNPYTIKRTITNFSQINQLLNCFHPDSSKLKVLDFGMGWGGWCKAAQLMGLEVYGTEISQSQIEFAKTQGLKVIDYQDIPNYNMDIINLEQVLEHVESPYQLLSYLVKSLSSQGLIQISVPNARYVKKYLNKNMKSEYFYAKGKKYSLNSIEPLQHVNAFNYESLIYIGKLLGLKEYRKNGNYYKDNIKLLTFKNLLINYLNRYIPINRKRTNIIFQKK